MGDVQKNKYNKVIIDGVYCVPVPERILLKMIKIINERKEQ